MSDLFELVQHYADLGDHRSGTPVDRRTIEWLRDRLADQGVSAQVEPLRFDRFEAKSELTVDGQSVDHLPLYYSWTGSLSTSNIRVIRHDVHGGGLPDAADAAVREAVGDAEAVIVATEHPEGLLVAVNRDLAAEPLGVPVVLVGSAEADRLQAGRVQLDLDAAIVPGESANLVGRNKHAAASGPGDPLLLLTTPTNGWFQSAGERGCGVAMLVDFAERFSDTPVMFVATGGHELGCFGATRWVADHPVEPTAIVHLGASLAVEEDGDDGTRTLAGSRLALTSVPGPRAVAMADALGRAGYALATDLSSFIGEGVAWASVDAPLLSFTGMNRYFHTPHDTPDRATSPESLSLVADAIAEATDALLHLRT